MANVSFFMVNVINSIPHLTLGSNICRLGAAGKNNEPYITGCDEAEKASHKVAPYY